VNGLSYRIIWLLETLLRFFPLPCRTGLRAVGAPGPEAPVLLTGNYHLSVVKLERSLRGINCWLLVADSGGINVWCAAAGGRLTDHQVISALKTSGIEQRVRRRVVILPQLAAAGVRARRVEQASGWQSVWGPVYAQDIREFLCLDGEPAPRLRETRFPWYQRLEMGLAWAFPLGVLTTLVLLFLSPGYIFSFLGLTGAASFLAFLGFPLYAGRRPSTLRSWGLLSATLIGLVLLLPGQDRSGLLLHLGFACLLALLLAVDLKGSTPLHGGGFLAEKSCCLVLRRARCRGSHDCARVCPRGCFVSRPGGVMLRRPERCIRCGACIVQCPTDALCFRDAAGAIVPPVSIRERKLSMSGRRTVRSGD
jgi:ferredoxin